MNVQIYVLEDVLIPGCVFETDILKLNVTFYAGCQQLRSLNHLTLLFVFSVQQIKQICSWSLWLSNIWHEKEVISGSPSSPDYRKYGCKDINDLNIWIVSSKQRTEPKQECERKEDEKLRKSIQNSDYVPFFYCKCSWLNEVAIISFN